MAKKHLDKFRELTRPVPWGIDTPRKGWNTRPIPSSWDDTPSPRAVTPLPGAFILDIDDKMPDTGERKFTVEDRLAALDFIRESARFPGSIIAHVRTARRPEDPLHGHWLIRRRIGPPPSRNHDFGETIRSEEDWAWCYNNARPPLREIARTLGEILRDSATGDHGGCHNLAYRWGVWLGKEGARESDLRFVWKPLDGVWTSGAGDIRRAVRDGWAKTRRRDGTKPWPNLGDVGLISETAPAPPVPVVRDRSRTTLIGAHRVVDIHGRAGAGKTFAAIALTRQAEGRVVWVVYEKLASTTNRLRRVLDDEARARVRVLDGHAMGRDWAIDDVLEDMAMVPDPGLVIIDSVSSSGCPISGENIEEWASGKVRPWSTEQSAVVLLDHAARREEEDRSPGAIGSTTKTALVEASYLVDSSEKVTSGIRELLTRMVLVCVKQNDSEGTPSQMTVEIDESGSHPVIAAHLGQAERDQAIFARVAAGEPQTQVARDFGISQGRVSQIHDAQRKKNASRA